MKTTILILLTALSFTSYKPTSGVTQAKDTNNPSYNKIITKDGCQHLYAKVRDIEVVDHYILCKKYNGK